MHDNDIDLDMAAVSANDAAASARDPFDRQRGMLEGLPGVVKTKPSTTVRMVPMLGTTETFIVQTYRHRTETNDDDAKREPSRDYIFLQHIDGSGRVRKVAIPPVVADLIARQRDALGTKIRKRVAKRVAAERKAAGWKPTFGGKRGRRDARRVRKSPAV
jgi:hypothetical protein